MAERQVEASSLGLPAEGAALVEPGLAALHFAGDATRLELGLRIAALFCGYVGVPSARSSMRPRAPALAREGSHVGRLAIAMLFL